MWKFFTSSGQEKQIIGSLSGQEVSYGQTTLSTVPITATVEASSNVLITAPAFTADGVTPYLCEIFAVACTLPTAAAGDAVLLSLFEGATQITRLWNAATPSTGSQQYIPVYARFRFTPAAGSHTYTLNGKANTTTGTPGLRAGSSVSSDWPPAFIRFTRAA